MKKFTMVPVLCFTAALLSSCGAASPTAPPADVAPPSAEAAAPDDTVQSIRIENEFTAWLPEQAGRQLAQKTPLPELASVIAETYQIPEEDWDKTRYYYDYVDLNDDGTEEIFAVVLGMYTSGSGGDSGLLVLPYAGMTVSQSFTLLRTPILISDEASGDGRDLIYLRSGGGSEPALVRLTCTDGVYTSPANAPALESLDGISGTAILCDDLFSDMAEGSYLTLADR